MKTLVLLLLAVGSLRAEMTGSYTHFQKLTLSGSTIKLTVQQIASGTRELRFVSLGLQCTVNVTFTLSLNGTAANATAGTVKKNYGQTATATVWTASNVGAGTTHRTYDVIGGVTEQGFDLSRFILPRGGGTAANLTLTSSSATGDCSVSIVWEEWK